MTDILQIPFNAVCEAITNVLKHEFESSNKILKRCYQTGSTFTIIKHILKIIEKQRKLIYKRLTLMNVASQILYLDHLRKHVAIPRTYRKKNLYFFSIPASQHLHTSKFADLG